MQVSSCFHGSGALLGSTETFVGAVDQGMLQVMKAAEKEGSVVNDSRLQARAQSERPYSLLAGLMKQKPLRLVRVIPEWIRSLEDPDP